MKFIFVVGDHIHRENTKETQSDLLFHVPYLLPLRSHVVLGGRSVRAIPALQLVQVTLAINNLSFQRILLVGQLSYVSA